MTLVRKSLLLLVLMLAAFGSAIALRPTQKIAGLQPAIDLITLIPKQFVDWHEEPQNFAFVVNPQQKASLDKIYQQTLSRTYVGPKGYRIMLSVAYGGDQSDDLQVHRPEICYVTQGFQVLGQQGHNMTLPEGSLPVKRLVAVQGKRNEPITYWITVGDQVTYSSIGQKLAQLRYGFMGKIPDGMLIRVSSIDGNESRAHQTQEEFIRAMLAGMGAADRARITGRLGG